MSSTEAAGPPTLARAASGIARNADWRVALEESVGQARRSLGEDAAVDLALLFANSAFADEFEELTGLARERLGAKLLAGCSGQGVIGVEQELEGEPAVSVLALSLPGADLCATHITQRDLESATTAADWHRLAGAPPDDVNAWLLFADPFTLDAEGLLAALSVAYPDTPLVGGLASGDHAARRTHLFLDGAVHGDGAVAVALGGAYTVRAVVSQGCAPIGSVWTITEAQDNIIASIGSRSAYEVLLDTVRSLPPEQQQRAVQGNVFVGLAMDEYREEYTRGDFLIRNLLGGDREQGLLAVGAAVRAGQTLQFQLRGAEPADEDLREMLDAAKRELEPRSPVAALLCSCNGRGAGLFGAPHHDALAVAERIGPMPLTGFFCNGEIGPVGGRNFLHGFTASLAFVVPKEAS